jgi:hypothetical protein
MSYAAKIEDGVVVEFIVGTAEWATNNFGGQWHDSETKVGAGWTWDEDYGFRPEQPYPSWVWDNGWMPPVPYPDFDAVWNEDSLSWIPAPIDPDGPA